MTREEEKSKAATTIAAWIIGNGISFQKVKEACVMRGIEWADQHPREGFWDAEKVIEWLRNNSSNYMTEGINYPNYAYNALVDDLRKAMETES